MARLLEKVIGPASSTGSPITFMMRPSVPSPTGTAMAWPVSCTGLPRTRPSVESIATVRTVDSPRCCATSRIRRLPLLSVSNAFRISGSGPSNCTSITAPMICVMRPILLLAVFIGAFMTSSCERNMGSSDGQGDFDVASCRFGIRTYGVGLFDESLKLVFRDAGNRESQIGLQKKPRPTLVEGYRASDLGGLPVYAVLFGYCDHRLIEAGRIAQREKLLGIVALCRSTQFYGEGHGQRQRRIFEHCPSVAAALASCLCRVSHQIASAPEIISISSLVIIAWRLRLYCNVRRSITSPALRVAESIALMRAPCSDAAFSRRARKICTDTLRGSRSARISASSGS